MKNRYTLLTAGVLCLGLAACGNSSLLAPTSPSFDGGHTLGSGNRADGATVTTTSDGTTVERGGHGFGSGNRVEDPTVTTATADGTTERSGHTYGSGN
ncbi:MAG TPA: hypothetical protein VF263_12975 [Longimicrobiaceae bacterium]